MIAFITRKFLYKTSPINSGISPVSINYDENPEFSRQVLNENNISVFASPEWFVVIN